MTRKFNIDDQVLVRPKFSRGFPKKVGVVYDIANGKYQIRWPDGDSGWFSSSDLQKVVVVEDRHSGAIRGWEHRRERDDFAAQNIPPEYLPLWEVWKNRFKGTPHERFESFMEFAQSEDGQQELLAITQDSSDEWLKKEMRRREREEAPWVGPVPFEPQKLGTQESGMAREPRGEIMGFKYAVRDRRETERQRLKRERKHESHLVPGTRVRLIRGQQAGMIGTVVDGYAGSRRVYVETDDGLRWAVEIVNLEIVPTGTVREQPKPDFDPFYIIQGLYNGPEGYGTGEGFGFDDEQTALDEAKKLSRSPYFEGDYVRVITHDGELVWDSRGGERTSYGTWALPEGLEEARETGGQRWKSSSGSNIQAPLSWWGDYVISHRPNDYTVSYRPTGHHVHVGSFTTLALAKAATREHAVLSPEARLAFKPTPWLNTQDNLDQFRRDLAAQPGLNEARSPVVRDYEGMSFEQWLSLARQGHGAHIRDDQRARSAFTNGMDPEEFAEIVTGGFALEEGHTVREVNFQRGERLRIRVKGPQGQPFESFWYTVDTQGMTLKEIALQFAQTGQPGMLIEIIVPPNSAGTQPRLKWTFRQERHAGLPAVTPVRGVSKRA